MNLPARFWSSPRRSPGISNKVYQAMGYGALDAIDTPILGTRGEISGAAVLLHKIELIGKLLGKPVGKLAEQRRRGRPVLDHMDFSG